MTETSKLGVVLSIEHDQRIDLTADGQVVRGYATYIREYVGMLESGLMARMSNAGYKILHALALRARILGDPRRPGAKQEYQELRELGIVADEDRGQLFCFPSRERLLTDTGIKSVHTVDAALDELVGLQLIKRITVSQPRRGRGFFGSNIYLIHPGSFIGKFDTLSGDQKAPSGRPVGGSNGEEKAPSGRPAEKPGGEQKLLPAEGSNGGQKAPSGRPAEEPDGEQKVLPVEESNGEQKLLPAEGSDGEHKVLPVEESDGEQKAHAGRPVEVAQGQNRRSEQTLLPAQGPAMLPEQSTESSLRYTVNRALKRQDLLTTTTIEASPAISRIGEFFARAIGREDQKLNDQEAGQIAALLRQGFSEEEIQAGITGALAHAREKGRKASLGFCMRSIRHLHSRQREIVTDSGKSSTGEIVTLADRGSRGLLPSERREEAESANHEGKSYAQIVTAEGKSSALLLEDLGLDEPSQAELGQLVVLLGEHSNRSLTKADARRWKVVADEFGVLAAARGITALTLVRQAVEEAFDAGSARDGYCAPKLARAILARWANGATGTDNSTTRAKGSKADDNPTTRANASKRNVPPAVLVYRQVRRRYPARELWEPIAQTIGTEESALAFWQEVLTTWVARGYNPLNVEGPLQWFQAHAIPQRTVPSGSLGERGMANPAGRSNPVTRERGYNGEGPGVWQNGYGRSSPSPASAQRPIERLEVIQERLRQTASERAVAEGLLSDEAKVTEEKP